MNTKAQRITFRHEEAQLPKSHKAVQLFIAHIFVHAFNHSFGREQEEGTQCTKSPSIRHFRGFFGELQQSYGTLNMRNTSGSFSLADFGIIVIIITIIIIIIIIMYIAIRPPLKDRVQGV